MGGAGGLKIPSNNARAALDAEDGGGGGHGSKGDDISVCISEGFSNQKFAEVSLNQPLTPARFRARLVPRHDLLSERLGSRPKPAIKV